MVVINIIIIVVIVFFIVIIMRIIFIDLHIASIFTLASICGLHLASV